MFCLSIPRRLSYDCRARIIVISICQFIFSAAFCQTTYYVAATGNDSNNGTSASTPFQSLTKINQLSLQPRDSVLFRRGDTFRGTLTIRRSGSANRNIVFDAYGSGQKPMLSGSVPITNWSNVGTNLWQAICTTCGSAVTGLYRNGVPMPLGRYPNPDDVNKGNLTIRAHTDHYQIFSKEPFLPNVDFFGAEVILRPTAWILDKATVGAQFGNDVLNLTYNSNYPLTDNTLFFFQNHPGTLDRNGEWCYNAVTHTLLVYDTLGTLTSQLVTATVTSRAVDIINVSYVSLRNLQLVQTLNTSLYADNVSNLTMTGLDIIDSGEDGVRIAGYGSYVVLENSNILDVNNNGLQLDAYQNVTLRGNIFRRIGAVAGRGKSGDGQYNGVQSAANVNVLIEHNVIDSIGYNGLTFGNNTMIRQNVISDYCICKVDGGGIYAWNGTKASMTNSTIESNIIYTSPGARGKYYADYSIGIFLDDCVENVAIKNNTIFGNTQWGVFLHGSPSITFTDNTLFDNDASQFVVYHDNGYCPIRNNIIKRNVFVSKKASQLAGQYESNANDLLQYGVVDSNYYARPFNEDAVILGVINSTQGGNYSLNGWKNFSGLDLHSRNSPITYKQYKNDGAGGTNRFASNFEMGTDGWEVIYSSYNNAAAVVDPNKLDGSSLRVSFPNPSGHPDSYAQVVNRIGTLTKGKTYVLRFDAVASVQVNILVYLRSYGPPYEEYDRRYTVSLSPTRTSYEFPFVPSAEGIDPVVMFQIDGEGPTFWLDNIRLQEDVPILNNPDEFIKLFYNPTLKDSIVTLTGVYRDVKNQAYNQSVTLKPFTSIILLKDTLPVQPADLSLSLQSEKRIVQLNEPNILRLRVSNQGSTTAGLARWTYRLPANLEFVRDDGQAYSDNVLTGTVYQLAPRTDTTFKVIVRPTAAGLFRTAAQLTTATSPDPDSSPNSGTADGEDDTTLAEFRVIGPTMNIFESPNPNQRTLPSVLSNQPIPKAGLADLSLRMAVSRRAPAVGEIITVTLYVTNSGGLPVGMVQLENQLPDGFEPVNISGWIADGRFLRATLTTVAVNTTLSISFQARIILPGIWINQAQISASSVADPDSTPGNGFLNGEDDQAQDGVRGR